jgi:hypothetical protein
MLPLSRSSSPVKVSMPAQFRSLLSPLQIFIDLLSQSQIRTARLAVLAMAILPVLSPAVLSQTPTPVPVLTWRYDLTHSGANTQETALTPVAVASGAFGKLFSVKLDDYVFAQPLYVPNLTMSDGKAHNVVFIATENNTIYAFDADAKGSPIWQVSLNDTAHGAASGATPKPQADVNPSADIGPNIGITGTPAIDPATNTIYVVSNTKESGKFFSRLHAINIITGAERMSPVNITATVAGTGDGSSGGQVSFDPLWSNQRAALDYYNGYVYVAYSSHGDISPYHGWLFAYDASTLKQTAVLCLSPNDKGASVWGSGAGLPIDTKTGRMFVVTGNGHITTPFQAGSSYGESVLNFNIANGQLTPTDIWSAFNYQTLNHWDWDQGSGGSLMLPDQPGAHPHELITAGKEGRITVLDRDNLGGLASGASSNTNAVQDVVISSIPQGEGFWSTAAYWNENVYVWAGGDNPLGDDPHPTPNKGMHFVIGGDGQLNPTPKDQTTFTSSYPGVTFSVSSNGTQSGIVWGVRVDQFNSWGPGVLYAFDADDLTNILYESDANGARDAGGPANKFAVPVVTNGKVYIAEHTQLDVYGILNGTPAAVAPTISPNGGTFSSAQNVTLSSSTPSADIYYTLDGSTPTPSTTLYSAPISISSTTTIKAIATASGYTQSAVSSATFTITTQAPPPAVTFSPAAGTYSSAQSVTLADGDRNAKIYYTTDGSAPSSSSTAYAGPINVAVSQTVKAIAIDASTGTSSVATAAYVIQAATTTSFTLSGPAVSVTAGSSGTSTITIKPTGGFTGSVTLKCAITGSPNQATNVPTCSVTQPAAISGDQAVTAMLKVGTTAPSSQSARTSRLAFSGGAALAGIFLFGFSRRRRRWQATLGLLLLFAIFTTAATGCTSVTEKRPVQQTGTTPGTYTVTVTGTSGSLTSATTINVNVQ